MEHQLPTISASEALERLSLGEPIREVHIAGALDLDPLVISRWLCGEDLRGVYQPVVLHGCRVEMLELQGRTFYEMVEIVECIVLEARLARAYFYSNLLIEDSRFEARVDARHIQADGRVVIHNTLFAGYVDFGGLSLRQHGSLSAVRFAGGTNLLHETAGRWATHFPAGLSLRGCAFRSDDVPPGFDLSAHHATLLY